MTAQGTSERTRETGGSPPAVRRRWTSADAGDRYRKTRWRTQRAGQRDLLLVKRILERHGREPWRGGILDAPCGTGRLRPVLDVGDQRYVGLDVSPVMLAAAEDAPVPSLVRASADELPFADDTFDVVVSCRLLHHLQDRETLQRFVHELTRVSARLVIASFWDAASLPAWRRRVGLRKSRRPEGRHAVPKVVLKELFEAAGAPIVGFHHSFRFVSQQTFLVAHKYARSRATARHPERQRGQGASELLDNPAGLGGEGALGQA